MNCSSQNSPLVPCNNYNYFLYRQDHYSLQNNGQVQFLNSKNSTKVKAAISFVMLDFAGGNDWIMKLEASCSTSDFISSPVRMMQGLADFCLETFPFVESTEQERAIPNRRSLLSPNLKHSDVCCFLLGSAIGVSSN